MKHGPEPCRVKEQLPTSPCCWRSWHAVTVVTLCVRGHPPCHLRRKRPSIRSTCILWTAVCTPCACLPLGCTGSGGPPAPAPAAPHPASLGDSIMAGAVVTCAAGEAVVPASGWPAHYPRELAPRLPGPPVPAIALAEGASVMPSCLQGGRRRFSSKLLSWRGSGWCLLSLDGRTDGHRGLKPSQAAGPLCSGQTGGARVTSVGRFRCSHRSARPSAFEGAVLGSDVSAPAGGNTDGAS